MASPEESMIAELRDTVRALTEQLGKVIVGQNNVIEQLLIGLCSRGHCLLVGVPGLAKTLLVSSLAKILDLSFKRIQFTPDLMPADITGTDILQDDPETNRRKFVFLPGPLFANMILADEINRTPPKTQAALLEAMQEHHVTAGGHTYPLPAPFFVLATQNPIEQEGTYPLPEAQLDRFMFQIEVTYPSRAEELTIMKQTTAGKPPELTHVLSAERIMRLQELVREVIVADHVFQYSVDLVRATRPKEPGTPKWLPELVSWGAGPRASQYLILAGKARAILHGRVHVSTADIKEIACPVLRHRLITTFHADAEGITTDNIIERLLKEIPLPQETAAAKLDYLPLQQPSSQTSKEPVAPRDAGYDDDDDRPRRKQGTSDVGGVVALIPFRNGMALAAYYTGVFGLIGCFLGGVGGIVGILPIILGILGLKKANRDNQAGGRTHAWVGIALGALELLTACAVAGLIAYIIMSAPKS